MKIQVQHTQIQTIFNNNSQQINIILAYSNIVINLLKCLV
jgi:hypothetical protein